MALIQRWALGEMVRKVKERDPSYFWELKWLYHYSDIWADLLQGPEKPEPPPEVFQTDAALRERVGALEKLTFDLIERVALGDPMPQPSLLSEGNVFRELGGVEGQREALKRHIGRLEEAQAAAKAQMESLCSVSSA